jgi:hypothetical protein
MPARRSPSNEGPEQQRNAIPENSASTVSEVPWQLGYLTRKVVGSPHVIENPEPHGPVMRLLASYGASGLIRGIGLRERFQAMTIVNRRRLEGYLPRFQFSAPPLEISKSERMAPRVQGIAASFMCRGAAALRGRTCSTRLKSFAKPAAGLDHQMTS